MDALIETINEEHLKQNLPEFGIGDTLRVSTRIIEGDKERLQVFQGTVIARKGRGLSETFSLHRVSYGEGMERVFYLHSPRIADIQVVKQGDVSRAKLYYMRGATGKRAKVQEKIGLKKEKRAKGTTPTRETSPDLEEVEATTAE
ncbi:MAG: 50S ribosomal protein L19 [Verrucomicrobia bacterium]|nr:50S ribosomal protein L19 [Verrucomicrobiota bacterium]MBS0645553.1 50S ribosomal protein L19 [Verrucomicrobiota bacterium]